MINGIAPILRTTPYFCLPEKELAKAKGIFSEGYPLQLCRKFHELFTLIFILIGHHDEARLQPLQEEEKGPRDAKQ